MSVVSHKAGVSPEVEPVAPNTPATPATPRRPRASRVSSASAAPDVSAARGASAAPGVWAARGALVVPAPRTRPVVRRGPVHRPPTRRQVAGAPRVLSRRSCPPRRPQLPVGWLLAVVVATAIAVVGLGSLANSIEPSVPSSTTVVRVKPGENLWDLAGRVAPGADRSAVVERIRELNDVEGAVLPGQPLTVPVERG